MGPLCSLLFLCLGFILVQAKYNNDLQRSKGFPPALSQELLKKDRTSLKYVYGLVAMKDKNYKTTFCSRSQDDCKTVKGYPGSNCDSILDFETIVKELPTVPARERRGEIRRLGDLGYFIFSSKLWASKHPLDDWVQFPIGASLEYHALHRPTADALWGEAAADRHRDAIGKMAQEYIESAGSITVDGLTEWNLKLLHKITLNYDMSDEEASSFRKYQSASTVQSILPRFVAWIGGRVLTAFKGLMGESTENTDFAGLQAQREKYLDLYEKEISKADRSGNGHLFDICEGYTKLPAKDRRFLADLILTAFTSAGGLSIPTLISVLLGTVYGGFYESPWKPAGGKRVITKSNIKQLIYETVRRFPGVVGFPYWYGGENTMDKRMVLNIAMALRDEKEWGETEEFRLRDLADYEAERGGHPRISIAWAEHAQGPNGLTEDSRGCPARHLSVVIMEEFLKALEPVQNDFKAVGEMKITEGPSKVSQLNLKHKVRGKQEL